eukprot:TRINITY_DN6014_c0_g1_i6.p1 TRINITY_DN6014_c0_g1~~TRINITY_DN6014_c0_g1_i6.p1  ORF type:complete len:733 (+),score=173.05 TRINITY_DN6014_c0_g1_i6:1271-3469(+)
MTGTRSITVVGSLFIRCRLVLRLGLRLQCPRGDAIFICLHTKAPPHAGNMYVGVGVVASAAVLACAYRKHKGRFSIKQLLEEERDAELCALLERTAATPAPEELVMLVGNAETPNKALRVLLALREDAVVNARLESGWSTTLAAAAAGNTEGMLLLLDHGGNPVCETYHVIHVAATNGHVGTVRALLQMYPDSISRATPTGETPLHMAARSGHWNVMSVLISKGAPLDEGDKQGNTPLHLATYTTNVLCIRLLVNAGAKFVRRRDGLTPLHTAIIKGKMKCIKELLHLRPSGMDLESADKFGQTPLHVACSHLQLDACLCLIKNGADIYAKDHDGLTPLHSLLKKPAMKCPIPPLNLFLEVVDALKHTMGEGDNDGYTPMHVVSCIKDDAGEAIAKHMVALGCDPTVENAHGWTPLHMANERGNTAVFNVYASKVGEEWLRTFDPNKAKMAIDTIPSHIACIAEEKRKAVLDDNVTLEGVCKLISSGRVKNIIALTGAGISVASGIPDYRSKDGVYRQQGTADVPVRDMFSEAYCLKDPQGFYTLASKLFHNKEPSLTHRFLKLLDDKGLLRRVYTQNVDDLEVKAGIPRERVVQCHGTFGKLRCTGCAFNSEMKVLPGDVPVCPDCGAALRPDVVFFGEPLPDVFNARHNDMSDCDLLLVMGTSLVVYPFAGLPNEVNTLTPRLLINKEETGPWKNRSIGALKHNYRDVFAQGACDDVVGQMTKLIGWDLQ